MNASRVNVLVVEDSTLDRMVLTARLKKMGMESIQARSAEDALKLLTTMTPDILFVDWQMPGMDGLSLLDAMRTRLSSMPYVIMVSAESDPQRIAVAEHVGIDDYLRKPVVTDDLERVTRAALIAAKVA